MPTEDKFSFFSWRPFILWPLGIVILYVLSYGPIVRMQEKGLFSIKNRLVRNFYAPLWWAYGTKTFHKPLGMYLHLWDPDFFDDKNEKITYKRFNVPRQLKQ